MEAIDYNIKIKVIEIVETHLVAQPADFNGAALDYHLEGNKTVNEENNNLRLDILVTIKEVTKPQILGAISIALGFEIAELIKYISLDPKSHTRHYNIDKALDYELDIISIHTLRGIMFSNFRGTYLYKAILPIFTFKDKHLV